MTIKQTRHFVLSCVIGITAFSSSWASSSVLTLTDSLSSINVTSKIYDLEDTNGLISAEDIVSGKYNNQFIKYNKERIDHGNVNGTFWHRLRIKNDASPDHKWMLIADNHHLDSISLIVGDNNGSYSKEKSGRLIPYNHRKFKFNTFAFEIPIESGIEQDIYLKVNSYLFVYPIKILRYDEYTKTQSNRSLIQGSLIGFLLMIGFYNLFLYFTVRDKNYLFYVFYVFTQVIKICEMKGYMDFFWQGPMSFMREQSPGLTVLNSVAMVLFSIHFLDFKKNLPWALKVLVLIFIPLGLASLGFNIVDDKLYSSMINQVGAMSLLLFMYTCAVLIYRSGFRPARFYIIAVTAFFISVFLYPLTLLGLLPFSTSFLDNSYELGAGVGMLLFSFALADKINVYKKEKQNAEQKLLKSLRENEKLIKNQNKLLELKVEERTRDLIAEKKKSDDLLLNILPGEVARELKSDGQTKARYYENTSVLFTDFVNFTGISASLSPIELVVELNKCFTAYDHIVSKNHLER